MNKGIKYSIFGVSAFILFGAAVTGCGNSSQVVSSTNSANSTSTADNTAAQSGASDTNTNTSTGDSSSKAVNNMKIGDTVDSAGYKITLNSVRTSQGNEYETPQNGKFVIANITVKNVSQDPQDVSSMAMFTLQDQEGYQLDQTVATGLTKGDLDTTLQPGRSVRGEIIWDVPSKDKAFDLIVAGNMFEANTQGIYKITTN